MSLLDKASLIVTPNAYKESVLYSVVPNTTLGDMNVVRATTATRVNSAGLIEVVPRNLLTYSEDFSNISWTKARGSITTNVTTAPNGTLTADKFIPDTQINPHFIQEGASNITIGNLYNLSVYAKISEWNTVALFKTDSTIGVSFRLDTQTSNVLIGTPTSYSITSVGNNWYRLSVSFSATSTSDGIQIRVGNNSLYSIAGNNLDGVFLWGAQVENFATATTYFPTTTRLNIPRIDYTNGTCPSLLVEPQRTNLILYSEEFNNASWFKSQSSITANSINSPSGNLTADTFIANGTSNTHSIATNSVSFISGTTYTMSVFSKKNTNNFIQFVAPFGVGGMFANFDLNNGVVGTVGTSSGSNPISSIQNYGNGWYKCNMIFTSTTTTSSSSSICLVTSASAIRAESNSLSTSVYLWGAQVEQGSYASSYIPTVASTVTRNADVISKTGISSLIGQTEGTMFWEGYLYPTQVGQLVGVEKNGTDVIRLNKANSSNLILAEIYINGDVVYRTFNSIVGKNKIAFIYKSGDSKVFLNGALIITDTNSFSTSGVLDMISINSLWNSSSDNTRSEFNSIQLYKTALSDTECINLTTL